MQQHHFQDRADDDKAVEPVEERHEVGGRAEAVQLKQSLAGEEDEKDEIGHVQKRVQLRRLIVML